MANVLPIANVFGKYFANGKCIGQMFCQWQMYWANVLLIPIVQKHSKAEIGVVGFFENGNPTASDSLEVGIRPVGRRNRISRRVLWSFWSEIGFFAGAIGFFRRILCSFGRICCTKSFVPTRILWRRQSDRHGFFGD